MKIYDNSIVDCEISFHIEVTRGDRKASQGFHFPRKAISSLTLGEVGDSLQRMVYNSLCIAVSEVRKEDLE